MNSPLGFARFTFLFTYGDSNPKFPRTCPPTPSTTWTSITSMRPHTQRTLNTPQFIDNLSWTRGAHQMKFGTNMRFYQQNDQLGTRRRPDRARPPSRSALR